MAGPGRATPFLFVALATAVLVGILVLGIRSFVDPPESDVEIAVIFPSTSISSWPDFCRAVQLAAAERKLDFREDASGRACTIFASPAPIRFRWYPVIGSFEMQKAVREVCQRPDAPIAIVGANNTTMTVALGRAIQESGRPDWTPLLLMTTATADELINLVPDRTFRFGLGNRCQARAVVERLKQVYAADGGGAPWGVKAVLVQVMDNPFSLDLASNFERFLTSELQADFIAPPPEFRASIHSAISSNGWTLKTATGGGEIPTHEEQRLVDAVVDEFLKTPDARHVIVLPVGGELFARLCSAIDERFRTDERTKQWGDPVERLSILSGDSLDYFDFAEAKRGQVSPKRTPARVIFFSHANPVDATLGREPDSHNPAVGLNREVVRTLLDVLPGLGANPSPARLSAALSEFKRGPDTVFLGGERRAGGGAVVAVPNHDRDRFELLLPSGWSKP